MRILVFGASITQGFWDTQGGWVQRLRSHYDSEQVQDFGTSQPTIFNLGISGDSTKDILTRFEAETNARQFGNEKLGFIFSVGTNNAREENGKLYSTPDEYRDDIRQLITLARKFSDKILFVGLPACDEAKTTPVSWRNINYRNADIWNIETAMRQVCVDENLPHIAVFEHFTDKPELFADGLHPNDVGHELIASLVLPELEKLITS